jgi:hypothetical protein
MISCGEIRIELLEPTAGAGRAGGGAAGTGGAP